MTTEPTWSLVVEFGCDPDSFADQIELFDEVLQRAIDSLLGIDDSFRIMSYGIAQVSRDD